jgi:FecR protein
MATRYRLIWFALVTTGILVTISAQSPTPAPEGRVTSVFHNVELLPENAAARPALIDDRVDEGTALRTGDDSRSELTFADLTITRLGANTVFSFNKAGRSVRLDGGSILVCVRKNSGAAEIVTKAISIGITGTTVIVESRPISFDRLIVLEGDARFSLNDYRGESTIIRAGEILNVNAGARRLPKPGRVNLNRLLNTHPLIKDFPPLPSLDLILAAMQNQNPNAPTPPTVRGGSTGGLPVYGPTPPASWPGSTTLPGYPQPSPTTRPSPRRPSPTPTPTAKPTPIVVPTAKPTPRPTPKPITTPHRPGHSPKLTPTPKKKYPPVKKRPRVTPTPEQVIR